MSIAVAVRKITGTKILKNQLPHESEWPKIISAGKLEWVNKS